MVAPIRLAPQKQQERRSIRQITDRFEEFGWVVTPPSEDLGEDLIVHIYFEGRATGVLFHLQVKSITNLQERKQKEYLPYRFLVKDLKHWAEFELPVVLLIWDVSQNEGRWFLVKAAITQLDKRNPDWQINKKSIVHLPWNHTTDNVGLKELRQAIGRQLAPQITQGKSLQASLELRFSDDPQGREALKEFEAYLREGHQVTLEEKFISKIEVSAWLNTWFGTPDTITLDPNIHNSPILLKINLLSNEKQIAPQTIEGIIQSGQELITISNRQQQSHPLHFKFFFVIDKTNPNLIQNGQIKLTLNHFGDHVGETIQIQDFMQAFFRGGRVELSSPNKPGFWIRLDCESDQQLAQLLEQDKYFNELVAKLYKIQCAFNRPFKVPTNKFSTIDIKDIEELSTIIESGRAKRSGQTLTVTVDPSAKDFDLFLQWYKDQEPLTLSYQESQYEILGVTLETGPMIRFVKSQAELSYPKLLIELKAHSSNEPLQLQFTDAEITDLYPGFYLQEAKRLVDLLTTKYDVQAVYLFGSLALNQGFTPEIDIDLAISGLSDQDFLNLMDYIGKETRFPINIIELEYAPPFLKSRILKEGIKLYDKSVTVS